MLTAGYINYQFPNCSLAHKKMVAKLSMVMTVARTGLVYRSHSTNHCCTGIYM